MQYTRSLQQMDNFHIPAYQTTNLSLTFNHTTSDGIIQQSYDF